MADLILVIFALITGFIIAKLFELLFEVRYKQLQTKLINWFGIEILKSGE